jgi:hypothetical protein
MRPIRNAASRASPLSAPSWDRTCFFLFRLLRLGSGPHVGKLTPPHRRVSGPEGRYPADGRRRPVLRRGHAAYILVEAVEKPTDNGSASLLCCRVADVGSPETISPALPPGAFPHNPPRAWGPRLLRRKYPIPVLRARTGLRNKTPIPRQGAPRRGSRSRADVLPRGTARGRITHGRSAIP